MSRKEYISRLNVPLTQEDADAVALIKQNGYNISDVLRIMLRIKADIIKKENNQVVNALENYYKKE